MSSVLVSIADAITTGLNGGSFGFDFDAVRSYADWDDKLEDAEVLHVDVVPVSIETAEAYDRGAMRYVCTVDVGVRKRFGLDSQTGTGRVLLDEIDDLMDLMQEIVDFFPLARLTDFTDAAWLEDRVRVHYARNHLRENRQFTGIVRVAFEVGQAV